LISKAYITEWQQYAPWPDPSMVEQDLVICRALINIFNHPALKENLAFRGGTALFKLHMPAARYSEDIDLVQVNAEPIGDLMGNIREALDPWLGTPTWKQTQGRVTFRYRFKSEQDIPLCLKVEINTREHFSVYGFIKQSFNIDSRWFSGSSNILTYEFDELLGTKLRALYQRKKGRDLFDLWYALQENGDSTQIKRIIVAFEEYMNYGGHKCSRALFEKNLFEKRSSPQFTGDIRPLLRTDINWDFDQAFSCVMESLITQLPGDPWQGRNTYLT